MVSAVAATLALTTVLLSSAFAMPVDNAVLSAMAVKDVDASDASFAAELAAATAVDANGDHHLYFYAINPNPPFDWCGEIDAVSYVPAKIFELRHFQNLVTYVSCAPPLNPIHHPIVTQTFASATSAMVLCGATPVGVRAIRPLPLTAARLTPPLAGTGTRR